MPFNKAVTKNPTTAPIAARITASYTAFQVMVPKKMEATMFLMKTKQAHIAAPAWLVVSTCNAILLEPVTEF